MATTFLQPGDNVNLTAPAAVVAGQFVQVGAIVGAVAEDAASGAVMVVTRVGVHTAPKATGAAWTEGQPLYWDDTAKKFTGTATSNRYAAQAMKVAASGATSGEVLLVPGKEVAG